MNTRQRPAHPYPNRSDAQTTINGIRLGFTLFVKVSFYSPVTKESLYPFCSLPIPLEGESKTQFLSQVAQDVASYLGIAEDRIQLSVEDTFTEGGRDPFNVNWIELALTIKQP
jgi:hypothetical protein